MVQHSLFGDVAQTFLRHKTSHFAFSPHLFALFPGPSSFLPFNFPSSRIFGKSPSVIEQKDSFSHIPTLFRVHFLPGLHRFINFAVGSNGGYDFHPPEHPIFGKVLRLVFFFNHSATEFWISYESIMDSLEILLLALFLQLVSRMVFLVSRLLPYQCP